MLSKLFWLYSKGGPMSLLRETRRTKIVCTLGPACAGEILPRLLETGMNVARRNFSHGTLEDHGAWIRRLKELSRSRGTPAAILQDLAGPNLRIGEMAQGYMELPPVQEFPRSTAPLSKNKWGPRWTMPRLSRTPRWSFPSSWPTARLNLKWKTRRLRPLSAGWWMGYCAPTWG
jgi:hypothetical protein